MNFGANLKSTRIEKANQLIAIKGVMTKLQPGMTIPRKGEFSLDRYLLGGTLLQLRVAAPLPFPDRRSRHHTPRSLVVGD